MRTRFGKGLAGPNTVALLLTIGLLGSLVFGMVTIDSLRGEQNAQNRQVEQISTNSDALREQVKAAGEVPVAPPAKSIVSEPGKDGGKGDTGLPGRAPTTEEISSSVAVYCSTRTDCKGSPGAPSTIPGEAGTNGTDGQDSTVPGPVGPMGPASTVPGPKGDAGDAGSDGTDGDTGRGITAIACQDDGNWLFTMTDESSITVSGPCRVGIPATPKETP